MVAASHFDSMMHMIYFYSRRIVLYVCRPLSGKHKTHILCVLCAFAVIKILAFRLKCFLLMLDFVISRRPSQTKRRLFIPFTGATYLSKNTRRYYT